MPPLVPETKPVIAGLEPAVIPAVEMTAPGTAAEKGVPETPLIVTWPPLVVEKVQVAP